MNSQSKTNHALPSLNLAAPCETIRAAIDDLERLHSAFSGVAELIAEGGDLKQVNRDTLATLLGLLAEMPQDEYSAISILSDLVCPSNDLHCVNRRNLGALQKSILRMQKDAISRALSGWLEVRAAIDPTKQGITSSESADLRPAE